MDYSNLNNFLQNLELSQQNTEKKYHEKLINDGCNLAKNDNFNSDNKNKDLVLQRELILNNSPNFNFQVANPQRFTNESYTNNRSNNNSNNTFNEQINKYRFNESFIQNKDMNNDNRLHSLNINSKKFTEYKNNINNSINNRELIPTKRNFNLDYKN